MQPWVTNAALISVCGAAVLAMTCLGVLRITCPTLTRPDRPIGVDAFAVGCERRDSGGFLDGLGSCRWELGAGRRLSNDKDDCELSYEEDEVGGTNNPRHIPSSMTRWPPSIISPAHQFLENRQASDRHRFEEDKQWSSADIIDSAAVSEDRSGRSHTEIPILPTRPVNWPPFNSRLGEEDLESPVTPPSFMRHALALEAADGPSLRGRLGGGSVLRATQRPFSPEVEQVQALQPRHFGPPNPHRFLNPYAHLSEEEREQLIAQERELLQHRDGASRAQVARAMVEDMLTFAFHLLTIGTRPRIGTRPDNGHAA